ncbi:MAG TPA: thioredoxin [bacterium]|nr:thioredoxin [bacterium]HOL49748.1 thioredoxin [bacterium]HPO52155.1 thioredoxin [bacterium]HXK44634.1 thioredoxin [bacterium]
MKVLNDENFDAVLKENSVVLVDFYADWCGPCRMMAPVVEEIATELEGKMVVAKLNVDENPDIAARFQIFSIPTFILFKNGKAEEKIIGAVGKAGLLEKIKSYLGS